MEILQKCVQATVQIRLYGPVLLREDTDGLTRQKESPQEFTDRCRALAQRVTCQVDDPLAQRSHR